MKTIKLEGKITCKSPLEHGGNEKTGSVTGFRRIDMITNNGIEEIPFVEGNAIRGKLRRLFMKDFFDRLEFQPKEVRTYHLFFSGGTLEKVSSDSEIGTVNLELRKQIRDLLVPLSIFGGAFFNQMFTSKLKVLKAYIRSSELANIIFTPEQNEKLYSIHELMSTTFITRKDDLRLTQEDDDRGVAQQMLVEQEVLIPGTTFFHGFVLEDMTDIEESSFNHLLELWRQNPFIGAGSSTGNGEINFQYNSENLEKAEKYLSFLKDHKPEIIALLEKIDQPVLEKPKKKSKKSKNTLEETSNEE